MVCNGELNGCNVFYKVSVFTVKINQPQLPVIYPTYVVTVLGSTILSSSSRLFQTCKLWDKNVQMPYTYLPPKVNNLW